jgi:hypothetical protein
MKIYVKGIELEGIDSIDRDKGREKLTGSFVCCNEISGSIKSGEYLEQLRKY